ncbi:TPA: hypothetical protein ACFP4Q_000819 [Neisseria weaveri]
MEDFKFGDIYTKKHGLPFRMVFLHQNRQGDLTFGTEHGGHIFMPYSEFEKEMKIGRIVEGEE